MPSLRDAIALDLIHTSIQQHLFSQFIQNFNPLYFLYFSDMDFYNNY